MLQILLNHSCYFLRHISGGKGFHARTKRSDLFLTMCGFKPFCLVTSQKTTIKVGAI